MTKTSENTAGISATSSTTNIEVGPASEESNAELTHNTPIEMDRLNNSTGATEQPCQVKIIAKIMSVVNVLVHLRRTSV